MLYDSAVTPAVLGTAAAILTISLLVTLLYLHRMRLRFDELVNMMGKRFREGDFMVNLSHDLRTPLAVARGYGETLLLKKEELSGAQVHEYTELVVEKIRQVEGVVNQLFELAKIESPNFEPHREPFLFSEMMGEVLRAVGAGERVEQVGVEQGSWVEADVAMMERVVQNLVVNALEYTPAGGRIAISLAREGGELVFRIENDGADLPQDLMDWINVPGVEGGRPVRPAVGLAIVRKVLSLHGYQWRAQSEGGINRFEVRMDVYR